MTGRDGTQLDTLGPALTVTTVPAAPAGGDAHTLSQTIDAAAASAIRSPNPRNLRYRV